MNKQPLTPRIPAAQMALYGDPQRRKEHQFITTFRQLSEANKDRAIKFLEALATDDHNTVNAIKREIEIEQAYLERDMTRDQLADDLASGRTPTGLQDTVRAGLTNSAGGVA